MIGSSEDIIIACATPPGRSALGLIRISGPEAPALLHELPATRARGARTARLAMKAGELPVLVLTYPGPRSYTGEDVEEVLLPGNPILIERVIDLLIGRASALGLRARRAGPGEFTARAFLNGKMSLTQAEGVAATIAATSDAELRAAAMLTSGALGNLAHDLADRLASALALVEAGIDFTDQEDVVAIAPSDLLARLRELVSSLQRHLDRSVGFESLQAIPWVVLAGAPNAGKSTLFNALLGRKRAVVSPVAGTTRDILAEPIALETAGKSAEAMLVDMAGLDDQATGPLDPLMQEAARRAIERAELILLCRPADEAVAGRSSGAPGLHAPDPRLLKLRTKCDLAGAQVPADAEEGLCVSAATGEGLDALRNAISARLAGRAVSLAADAMALAPRHEEAMRRALAHLTEAISIVEPASTGRSLPSPELAASCLRSALDELGSLAGDITPDDILGRIFAGFCVGK